MNKYLTEFLGTIFLVFVIGVTAVQKVALAPIAIGAILMVMVYMGGHISGAHYNPAVSLAILIRGRVNPVDFVFYLVSQIAGALAASEMVLIILGKTFFPEPTPRIKLSLDDVISIDTAGYLLVEGLMTFALALVVLNVATSKDHPGNSFYGLAIGSTVMAGAFAVGGISGGAFNPAVGTGPILVDTLANPNSTALNHLWIYLAGPFAGGAVAGIIFRAQNPSDP